MKTLKKFDFGSSTRGSYDWDTILSGGIVQLESGSDYECKDLTMSSLIRNKARKSGKTVKIRVTEDPAGLVVQAEDATKEQRTEWAKQDAARKKAKAEAKGSDNGEDSEEEEDEDEE